MVLVVSVCWGFGGKDLFECFDERLELHLQRFVVSGHGRNLSVDTEQLIDGHLGCPH